MNYFTNCNTTAELRAELAKLALKYHPDRKGGDAEIMKAVNAAYTLASERIAKGSNAAPEGSVAAEAAQATQDLDEKLREKLMSLLAIDGVSVELVGTWFWIVHEDSRSIKDELKSEGCRWAPKKKRWYYAGSVSKSRGKMTMNAIRERYGSTVISGDSKKCLTN